MEESQVEIIANLEKARKKEEFKTVESYEIELLVDATISGMLDYGPYKILVWDQVEEVPSDDSPDPHLRGMKRRLCLSMELPYDIDSNERAKLGFIGFLESKEISSQIVALTSVFLRRRVWLGKQVRHNDVPSSPYYERDSWADWQLVDGTSDLSEIAEYLSYFEFLSEGDRRRYLLAAELYHLSLDIIEQYPEMAYLNLVFSLETLAARASTGIDLLDSEPELREMLQEIEDRDIKDGLTAKFRQLIGYRKPKFIAFVIENSSDEIWEVFNKYLPFEIGETSKRKILDSIYNQRSRTVHEGSPFDSRVISQLDFYNVKYQVLDIPEISLVYTDERGSYLPHVSLFERLANDVLKTYLRNKARVEG